MGNVKNIGLWFFNFFKNSPKPITVCDSWQKDHPNQDENNVNIFNSAWSIHKFELTSMDEQSTDVNNFIHASCTKMILSHLLQLTTCTLAILCWAKCVQGALGLVLMRFWSVIGWSSGESCFLGFMHLLY